MTFLLSMSSISLDGELVSTLLFVSVSFHLEVALNSMQ